jgi:predicted Zn-dependent protease
MVLAVTLPILARVPLRKLALAASALLLAAGPRTAMAAPYVPQSGALVVETLPRRGAAEPKELLALRAGLRATPNDVRLATTLAQRYIALGRSESDPRYFGYAQAALAPWWSTAAPPSQVRLLRATLLQTNHQFGPALADLEAVTASDPTNAQAWLTRATVQAVRGDYAAATSSCARLSTLAGNLVAFTCLASARANMGQLAASERLLNVALAQAVGEPVEVQVWMQTLLAELAARRNDPQADARFRAALALAPRDSYLLGAYADYLLDRGQAGDAERILSPFHRIDSLLLRHALALKQQQGRGRELEAARSELQARFDAAALRGDSIHLREQGRFTLHVLGDARTALALAQRNWAVQKELADLRLLLEAGRAAGDATAVAQGAAWVRQHGLEDAAVAALLKGGA